MKRILTGDRTTGRLNLGHYVGSLQNRVRLQEDYDTFIILADIQALTTHFENPELMSKNIYDVAIDNLSAGLDPDKITMFLQSKVSAIAELTVFFSMLVSVNSLRHNPTVKTEAKQYGYDDLSYGFLGYPVSQTADIAFCNADLVPVGEDQLPHIEQGRKIIKSAVTDKNRISVRDKGNPDICTVSKYHKAFNQVEYENICEMCKNASIGCVACKNLLSGRINSFLAPFREKRAYYEERRGEVRDIILDGSKKAAAVGNKTIEYVKKSMSMYIE